MRPPDAKIDLVGHHQPPLVSGREDLLEEAHLHGPRGIEGLLPRGKHAPTVVVAVRVVRSGKVRVVGLAANPQGRDREAVLRARFIGPFGHEHRLDGPQVVVLGHHRVDQLDAVPGLHRVEIQPRFGVDEAGGVGRGSGLKVMRCRPPSPSCSPAANSRRIGHELRPASGVMDQTMLGASLYALGQPLRPLPGVLDGDVLAISLMVERHGNGQVVVAGDPHDGIHVLEIRLVGRQRIVVDPGLLRRRRWAPCRRRRP